MCGKTLFLGDTLGNGKTIMFNIKQCVHASAAKTMKQVGSRDPLEE